MQHEINFKISVRELKALYLEAKRNNSSRFICHILRNKVYGYTASSDNVIRQFQEALPNRFRKTDRKFVVLPEALRAKYLDVADPRLSLLNALPEDLILTFKMYKNVY